MVTACNDFQPSVWTPNRCLNCMQVKYSHPQFAESSSSIDIHTIQQASFTPVTTTTSTTTTETESHEAAVSKVPSLQANESTTTVESSLHPTEGSSSPVDDAMASPANTSPLTTSKSDDNVSEQGIAAEKKEIRRRDKKSKKSRIHRAANHEPTSLNSSGEGKTRKKSRGLSMEGTGPLVSGTTSPKDEASSPTTSPTSGSPIQLASLSPVTSPRLARSSIADFRPSPSPSMPDLRLDNLESNLSTSPPTITSPATKASNRENRGSIIQTRILPSLSISGFPTPSILSQSQPNATTSAPKAKRATKKLTLPSSVRRSIMQTVSSYQQDLIKQQEISSSNYELPKELRHYFETSLCTLLRCMGLQDRGIAAVCEQIDAELMRQWAAHNPASPPSSPPSSPRTGRKGFLRVLPVTHIDPASAQMLSKLATDTEKFLKDQHQVAKLVKVQAMVRGYQTRKKYSALSLEEKVHIIERAEIFRELIKTERIYKRNLDSIVETYLKPLRTVNAKEQLLEINDIVAIFSNIETIAAIHKEFLEALETLNDHWPLVSNVGPVIIKKLIPNLEAYGNYAQNFQSAISTIQMLILKKPKAWAVIQELRDISPNREDGLGLHALLALPLSRISKYDSLLELLLNLSSSDEKKENPEIHSAYLTLRKFSEFIGKCLSQGKETVRLVDFQRLMIFPLGASYNLLKEGRYFIREISLNAFREKKKNNLLLFNDILVIAKLVNEKYHVKEVVDLPNIEVEELPDQGPMKFLFQISSPTKSYKYQCASAAERISWTNDLHTYIDRIKKKDKVFGAPLPILLTREGRKSGIPIAVERIVNWMIEKALDNVGVLRVSGNQKDLQILKEIFDKDPSGAELTNASPHDVANLLKLYFMELPEPLFGYELYDRFISVIKNKDLDELTRIETLRSIIHGGVPPVNIPLIKYMLDFYTTVVEHTEQNKMNIKNIAILVAPHFLHAREQTLENSQEIPFINTLMEIILEHKNDIFSEESLTAKLGRTLYRKGAKGGNEPESFTPR